MVVRDLRKEFPRIIRINGKKVLVIKTNNYKVLTVERPLSLFPRYRPAEHMQITNFGIDRLDATVPREWIDETKIKDLMSRLLHIEYYGRFCRISVNRELFKHTDSYRQDFSGIMYNLFKRGLFVVPLSRVSEGQVKLYKNNAVLNDDEGFSEVMNQIRLERVECFFDSPRDFRDRLRSELRPSSEGYTTYSTDLRRMHQEFFNRPSFLKVYDKVGCKLAKKEEVLPIEAKNRYRIELTLDGLGSWMSWKSLDTDNVGLIHMIRQHLSKRIEKVCPVLRSLVDEKDVHPELKKVLQTPVKKRLKLDRGLSRILKEGRSDWQEELREVMAEAERGCAESVLKVVSDEVNQDAPEVRVEVAPAPDTKPLKSGLPLGLGWPIRDDLDQYPRTLKVEEHRSLAPRGPTSRSDVDLVEHEEGRERLIQAETDDLDQSVSRNKGTRITKGGPPSDDSRQPGQSQGPSANPGSYLPTSSRLTRLKPDLDGPSIIASDFSPAPRAVSLVSPSIPKTSGLPPGQGG